jgi:hypothetical protein
MLVIRDIMHCKPGKVRPLVEKFSALNKAGQAAGFPPFRLMTDMCAERYWTVVAETEVSSLDEFTQMMRKGMEDKKMRDIMEGYHDLVVDGRREIYTIEK